jgi:translocation and assembly module TamB
VEARALLNDQQRVEFDFEASPMTSASDGGSSGIVRASGIVPLPEADDQSLAVDAKVRDAGMCILCAAASGGTDNVEWQSGNADIALHARGTSENPVFDGVAEIRRAKIVSPFLAKPFAPTNATIRIQRNTLYADDIEGRCGKGFVKIKGAIPVIQRRKSRGGDTWDNLVARADTQAGLKVDIQGLDVRARNAYNGQVNAGLVLKGTISAPEVGGSIQLSKGQVTATPGQPEDAALS